MKKTYNAATGISYHWPVYSGRNICFVILLSFLSINSSLTFAQSCAYTIISSSNCYPARFALSNNSVGISKIVWERNGFGVDSSVFPLLDTITTVLNTGRGISGAESIFAAANGNVYFSDPVNNQVFTFSPGVVGSTVVVAGGNGQGNGPAQLYIQQGGIFVDVSGNLYIADAGNNRIQKWAPGATAGTTAAGGNGQGSAPNQLNNPSAVFVDGAGNVYVSDRDNHRIQKWAPGASVGTTVAGGNGPGSNANQLQYPGALYANSNGDVYVADVYNNRIQLWPATSTAGAPVVDASVTGNGQYIIAGNTQIQMDGLGNIYYTGGTAGSGQRICVFRPDYLNTQLATV
jgi:sugar lactone lactonase YvrE